MSIPSTLILPYSSMGPSQNAGNSTSYTFVGRSMNRLSFRRFNSAAEGSPAIAENDVASSINTRAPATIDIRTQVKAPGAQGNDRIRISLKDTFLASDGLYKTDSLELSCSFARDPFSTAERRKGLIHQLMALLSGTDVATKVLTSANVSATARQNAKLGPTAIVRLNLDMVELQIAT